MAGARENLGVAIVSGASSGIGAETALTLARNGYSVVIVARRANRLQAMAEAHPDLRLLPVTADVRERNALGEAIGGLPEDYQDISVVINNAGLSKGFGPMQGVDPRLWREMIDTNVV